MEFEYDSLKSEANRLKHGISFEEAKELWNVPGFVVPVPFPKEERFIWVAFWEHRFYTAVFTVRGSGTVRIISVRRSREEEKQAYEEKFKNEKKENE